MDLVDRYVHEVGRYLPRKTRSDIQTELYSLLVDMLEDRAGPDPSEAEVVEFLKEYGSPRTVAASYAPQAQYLIGPVLYPLFQLVSGITLAAVIGAQLLGWGVAYFIGQEPLSPLDALGGLLASIPSALGSIVIVFAILQRFDVRPDVADKEWDPRSLPKIDETAIVKRGERVFGIVMGIAILVLLVFFPQWIGFMTHPGGEFYANPVIARYVGWISISILASVALDIYLLWQGRWTTVTRIAKVAVNLLSIAILTVLVQGHTAWLAEHGRGGLLASLMDLSEFAEGNWQIVGMEAFRMAFGVAAIVTVVETILVVYRMIRDSLRKGGSALTIPLGKS